MGPGRGIVGPAGDAGDDCHAYHRSSELAGNDREDRGTRAQSQMSVPLELAEALVQAVRGIECTCISDSYAWPTLTEKSKRSVCRKCRVLKRWQAYLDGRAKAGEGVAS